MKTAGKMITELREQYEKETRKRWWTNPVCHGETGFAAWEYQTWLEEKVISHNKQIKAMIDEKISIAKSYPKTQGTTSYYYRGKLETLTELKNQLGE